MGLYAANSLSLVCQQILRDNPDLPFPLTKDNILVLGGPFTTNLGTSGRKTRLVLNGKAGAGFTGRREFFYDRIDLSKLFKGITVVFEADGAAATIADLLPALNKQYGLGLEPADISNGDTKLGYAYEPTLVAITIAASSLAYTGSLSVTWTRKPSGVYPDSGPGSKTMLIGDMTAGYFGTVTQADLMTASDLYDSDRTTLGSYTPVLDNSLFWIKFALDGEIYFFPSNTLMTGVTWASLNAIGAVKGDSQYPWVVKTGDGENTFFDLTLPRSNTDDPMGPVRNEAGSVSARIFNKLHTSAYGTKEWDTLTFNLGNLFLWMNHYDNGTTDSVFVSQMNQATVTSTKETTAYNWRPMLKLVQGKAVVIPIRNVQGEPFGRIVPPAMTIDRSRDPSMPVRMINILGTYLRTITAPTMQLKKPTADDMTQSPKAVRGSVVVKPILMRITTEFTKKTPLSSLDGELPEFQ
ncbi:hypothetical protein pEaSNUABM6_00164 [Erwinia phage pEa_SNUABM_6]|nr:hypothetical protein pEaSNUABM6_00164 [Erwinia phage pEa_SNUABM_6]